MRDVIILLHFAGIIAKQMKLKISSCMPVARLKWWYFFFLEFATCEIGANFRY
jgi:hypothetical protein